MLIITGSGRCGTSAAANIAKRLGFDPGGTFTDRIRAGYEVPEISRLNDRIGEALKARPVTAVAEEFREEILAVQRDCLKCPRFVARPGVLEVWLQVRSDLEFLVLYRNPWATAQSAAQAFEQNGTPMSIAETARVIGEKFQRTVGILAERSVPFAIANFPTFVSDAEYARKCFAIGPLAVDPLRFKRAWREAVRAEFVNHPPRKEEDLIGAAMRPGAPAFEQTGNLYAGLLADRIGKTADVVEIGCGYGRIAEALARGDMVNNYVGFDCYAPGVLECSRRFGINPRFFFRHLNVRSARYNPNGEPLADGSIPELADSFGGGLAISLFTHLAPDDCQTMLREFFRILKPEGVLLATWFVAPANMAETVAAPDYRGPLREERSPGVWTAAGLLENAVGYCRETVLGWYASAGFEIVAEAAGVWHGGEGNHFQDVLTARKPCK